MTAQTTEYEDLSEEQRETMAEFIRRFIEPTRYVNRRDNSRTLCVSFEEWGKRASGSRGFAVTNRQMKGAMKAAGYFPADPYSVNWQFRFRWSGR
jgi:hypothetical protein